MNESQHMVRDFHIATNNPTPNYPTLKFYRPELRVKLLREETQEFADAVQNHYDFMKKQLPVDGTGAERLELLSEMADALCDILYVAYGAAVELGLDLEPLFDEVHKTNMRKAGAPEDGPVVAVSLIVVLVLTVKAPSELISVTTVAVLVSILAKAVPPESLK